MPTINLRNLAINQTGTIVAVRVGGELGRRIREMGLVPGEGPASQDGADLVDEGLVTAGGEVGVVVEPGDGLGKLRQTVRGPARAGQDLREAAGGQGRVAQHGEVPV